MDLLADALENFGCDVDVFKKGAEWCDVTIRCYLLDQTIAEVLDDMEEENEWYNKGYNDGCSDALNNLELGDILEHIHEFSNQDKQKIIDAIKCE